MVPLLEVFSLCQIHPANYVGKRFPPSTCVVCISPYVPLSRMTLVFYRSFRSDLRAHSFLAVVAASSPSSSSTVVTAAGAKGLASKAVRKPPNAPNPNVAPKKKSKPAAAAAAAAATAASVKVETDEEEDHEAKAKEEQPADSIVMGVNVIDGTHKKGGCLRNVRFPLPLTSAGAKVAVRKALTGDGVRLVPGSFGIMTKNNQPTAHLTATRTPFADEQHFNELAKSALLKGRDFHFCVAIITDEEEEAALAKADKSKVGKGKHPTSRSGSTMSDPTGFTGFTQGGRVAVSKDTIFICLFHLPSRMHEITEFRSSKLTFPTELIFFFSDCHQQGCCGGQSKTS